MLTVSALTRQTPEADLDTWNEAMRASPLYQDFVRRHGLSVSRGGWSRAAQSAWEAELARSGFPMPDGMHIDQGGNLNQKNRLGRNVAIGAAITAAAVATMGAAGLGPLAGVMGGGAGGAVSGTAATIASTGGGFWSGLGKFLGSNVGGQIIQTGGQIAGNVLQGRASDRAGDAMAQAAREALDFEKGVYEDDKRFFAPYGAQGEASLARISDLMKERRPTVTADSLMASGRVGAVPTISGLRGAGQTPAAQARPVPFDGRQSPPEPRPPVSTTMPVDSPGRRLGRPATPGLDDTPFRPGDPKANPEMVPPTPEQIENDRRRRASEAEGYGWGGRRPGMPYTPGVAAGESNPGVDTSMSAELVTMEAPTGRTFRVPAEKVAFYEQQGARVAA